MYYLLINSRYIIDTFENYFPLSYEHSDMLLNEMGKDTKALIFGQLLIAVIQGSLGGLGFFIFGLHGAILWGIAMVITSFIPVVGASIVWIPAIVPLVTSASL